MRKTIWNALVGAGLAVALGAWAPSALSASKKTPTPSADGSASTATKSDSAAKTAKVNLNTAGEKDIAAAKGVGAKLAKELVAGRPYKTWDDVSKVKGVGTGKKLDSLKKVLKLSEGVPAKEETATKETKGKKKSSSKADETAGAAGGAAAGVPAGGSSATGNAPASASSPSKKSSSSSSSEKIAPGTKININTASAEELDKLPEIGPVKAQAIVDYRNANGKFASPEDIMKVSGIKEGTFAKIKDYIVVR